MDIVENCYETIRIKSYFFLLYVTFSHHKGDAHKLHDISMYSIVTFTFWYITVSQLYYYEN